MIYEREREKRKRKKRERKEKERRERKEKERREYKMSNNKFTFLPSDDKIIRLGSCDFHLKDDQDIDKMYQVQTGLKKIINPILILLYYNNTSKKILTEFFRASRDTTIGDGKEEDIFRNLKEGDMTRNLKEGDMTRNLKEGKNLEALKFKFASVNLDYESELYRSFKNISLGNPFKWLEIVEGENYPFIVFYYQGVPQFIYEGIMNSKSLINEFSEWYSDLMENKKEDRNTKLEDKNGIYLAIDDNNIKYYDKQGFSPTEENKKEFSFIKGEIFRVTFLDERAIFSKNLDSGTDFIFYDKERKEGDDVIVSNFNIQDTFDVSFRKIDGNQNNNGIDGNQNNNGIDGNQNNNGIDESKLKEYQEMYKISHPGGIKKKKQIYLETDFFIKGLGDYKTSKEMREMMIQGGLNKDFISDRDIEEGTKKEKDKLDKLGDTYEKRKKLEDLLNQIRRFMKDENGKIENLEIYRKIEERIRKLITRIREYIGTMEGDIRDITSI